jgi:hypothetical protein
VGAEGPGTGEPDVDVVDHVLFAGNEIESAEVSEGVSFEGALVIEVEVLERLAGGEPGGFDATLAAVVLAGSNFSFQAGGQELFVGPPFAAGPFPEPADGRRQRWCLHRPAQVDEAVGLEAVRVAITPRP